MKRARKSPFLRPLCQEKYFWLVQYHAHVIDTLCTANPQVSASVYDGLVKFSPLRARQSIGGRKVSFCQLENPARVSMMRAGEIKTRWP
jgi:hypothetical protein